MLFIFTSWITVRKQQKDSCSLLFFLSPSYSTEDVLQKIYPCTERKLSLNFHFWSIDSERQIKRSGGKDEVVLNRLFYLFIFSKCIWLWKIKSKYWVDERIFQLSTILIQLKIWYLDKNHTCTVQEQCFGQCFLVSMSRKLPCIALISFQQLVKNKHAPRRNTDSRRHAQTTSSLWRQTVITKLHFSKQKCARGQTK